jgi:two-component system LytT family response regulator
MSRLRAVVVEDQPVARAHIVAMLEDLDVDVVATCRDGLEAVARVPAVESDVVFLDIELPELNAFEVIDAVGIDRMPAVVFITAYDSYSLRAFDVFASGYLLKPVQADRLSLVVERLKRSGVAPSAQRARTLAKFLASSAAPTTSRLVVHRAGRMVFVRESEIEHIEACGNYVKIFARGEFYQARQTMHNLQTRFTRLARIHRSYLVNLDYVVELRASAYGEYKVALQSGREIGVTRRFRAALQERLSSLP